jgi:hypothetical protein
MGFRFRIFVDRKVALFLMIHADRVEHSSVQNIVFYRSAGVTNGLLTSYNMWFNIPNLVWIVRK